jgi:hypothetical protein
MLPLFIGCHFVFGGGVCPFLFERFLLGYFGFVGYARFACGIEGPGGEEDVADVDNAVNDILVLLLFDSTDDGDVQHAHANSKRTLRLHAISADSFVFDDVAALGNEPRCTVIHTIWIDVVLARLDGDAVSPEGGKADVEGQTEDGV